MSSFNIATRREFLQGLGVVGVSTALPNFLIRTAMAGPQAKKDERVLVVIEMSGGNDGLSTVVPYANDNYGRLRRASRILEREVLKLNTEIGLHPNLRGLKELYDQDSLAVIQGVGYPNPNLSHFTSMDIWQLGDNEARTNSTLKETSFGWIGKYCDVAYKGNNDPKLSLAVGVARAPRAIRGKEHPGLCFLQPESFRYLGDRGDKERSSIYRKLNEMTPADQSIAVDFVTQTAIHANDSSGSIRELALKYRPKVTYPGGGLSNALRTVAGLIAGGLSTRVYYVFQGGYDTHYFQRNRHDQLMRELSTSISAFQQDLTLQGVADRVVGMTYSEFGRRVEENNSQGTDHGTAGPMFVFGKAIKAGLYGAHPSLDETKMERGRNLAFTTDFRSIYATLLEKWLDTPSEKVLGQKFETLGCLA